jgi:hypothetical protein
MLAVFIDVALVVTALEVLVLLWLRVRPSAIAGQLLAGVMLLLALRCAVRGADSSWTLLFFSASLPAHLYDLRLRTTRSDRVPN